MSSILWHQGRCIPSPREGEGDTNVSGEGYLKNMQKALNKSPRHLFNNKANLLTRLETRCNKILCTRHRMTGAGDANLVLVAVFLLPLTRSDAPTSPSRGEVNRLLRFARNDGRVKCEAVSLLLCVLLLKVSFFLPNPAKTC